MPAQPLGPTGLLAQSMTLPAGSQSMSMGGMGLRAQGMDGRKRRRGLPVGISLLGAVVVVASWSSAAAAVAVGFGPAQCFCLAP